MKKQSIGMTVLKTLGYVLLFFAVQRLAAFVAEVAITLSLLLRGVNEGEMQSLLPKAFDSVLYEIMFLFAFLFFGFLVLMQKKRFPEQNNARKTSGISVLASVFLGFAAYLAVSYLIGITSQIPAVQESQQSYMEKQEMLEAVSNGWIEFLYVVFMAPILEEFLCRGSILNTLKQSFSPWLSITVSALIFACIHGNLYQVVFTFPLGVLLGFLTHRFQSVWPSVALHAAFNGTNYLFRMGFLLGFDEDSKWVYFFVLAANLLCMFSVPIAFLLMRRALELHPAPAPKRPDFISYYTFPAEPAQTASSVAPEPKPENKPDLTEKPTEAKSSDLKGEPMAAPEYIIVGLGNPGEKYASNRHNCGFMALDYIALRQNATIQNLRFRALTGETEIEGKKVLLMKPQTFMNSSGEAVREAAAFYKIPPERVLVIFDDISFAPGIFRIRKSGSAGGHNGIKSIISCLSSDAFPRIKMGVGTPPPEWELMNWVLGNLPREDLDHIIASMEDVYATAKFFVKEELDAAIGSFNGKSH